MSICVVSSLWLIQTVLREPSHTCPEGPRATFCLVGTQRALAPSQACSLACPGCCQTPPDGSSTGEPRNVLEKSKGQNSLWRAPIYGFFSAHKHVCTHTHMHGSALSERERKKPREVARRAELRPSCHCLLWRIGF